VTTDRLGSVRSGGPGMLGYQAQFPYGAEYTVTANDREKYATYTRDSLTGLDYAMNRYYSSQWGRFLSPDPYSGSVKRGNPQSWNRYAYAKNDPVNRSDPSGLDDCSCWVGPNGEEMCDCGQVFSTSGVDVADDEEDDDYAESSGPGPFDPYHPDPNPTPGPVRLPVICNSKILQPAFLNIFAGMGAALGIDPQFIMALSLQESGANLVHVSQTNSSSGGQPLNNLFGVTAGGGNNLAFSSPQASADWWVSNYGSALANKPTTIQGFVSDLLNNPAGAYNSANPDWAVSIEGGYWTKDHPGVKAGEHTPGTYQSIVNWMKKCQLSF